MSKSERLEHYPLFFEEIGRSDSKNQPNDSAKKDRYKAGASLSEEQISALSADLQSPVTSSSQTTNPIR